MAYKLKLAIALFLIMTSVLFVVALDLGDIGKIDKNITKPIGVETFLQHSSPNTDLYRTSDGKFKTKIYAGNVNVEHNGEFVAVEDYINVSNDNGKIKFETLDGKKCWLELDYSLTNQLSIASPNINITKNRGNYYFTTNIGLNVDSMAYDINCTQMDVSFSDDKLYLDDVKIDFGMAKDLQNISTELVETVDSKNITTKTLEFKPVDGKVADLKYIDPVVSLDYSTPGLKDKFCYHGFDYITCYDVGDKGLSVIKDTEVSYLYFNISGVIDNFSDVTNATLSLYQETSSGGAVIINVSFWRLTGDWSESDQNEPSYDNSYDEKLYLNSAYTNKFINFSVTNLVNNLKYSGVEYGFMMNTSTPGGASYDASEDSTSSHRPTLILEYDDLIINTPIDDQEILNNLSTQLNISVAGYNQTIWYTLNDGIINNTLCTDSLECEGQIDFPRQGYYNLTVWGNNSVGTETSDSISDIFVGNSTIYDYNDNEDILSAWWAEDTGDTPPPQNSLPPVGFTFVDVTTEVGLNFTDHISWCFGGTWHQPSETCTGNSGDDRPMVLLNATLDLNTINSINWTIIISDIGESFDVYLWNYSSTEWVLDKYNIMINFSSRYSPTEFMSNNITNLLIHSRGSSYPDQGINYISLDVSYINISNTAPTINLITLNNTNLSTSNINISYNYTDDNDYVNNVSLYLDGSLNQTRTNPTDLNTNLNFSILSIADGTYTYYIEVCDSDNSCNQTGTNTFRIDSTAPVLSIVNPPNGAGYTTGTVDLNYTVSDSLIGLDSCWYQNDSGINVTISCGTNTTISQGSDGSYTIYMWANDTLGNEASTSNSWIVSSDAPALTLEKPNDNSWLNNKEVYFNFTAIDANGIDTCELWGNWTGTYHLNLTKSMGDDTSVDISEGFFQQNISDGEYKWNVWCNDSATPNKDTFALLNRTFGIDTTYPLVNLVNPQNITYTINTIDFNFTSSDLNQEICWWTNDSGIINHSISCSNTTYSASQGSNELILYTNDSANNQNSSNVTFYVDSIIPSIVLNTSFSNGSYLNYNESISINLTISDTTLNTCWYNDGINTTITCGTNLSLNVSDESLHIVYVYANDTLNNLNTSVISFYTDTIFPQISIDTITTTAGSQSITFDTTITDTYTDSCKYSITNSVGGIDGLNDNVSTTCSALESATVSGFATFNLIYYSKDLAGNENSSTQSFTTTSAVLSVAGGGGGGTVENFPVIGLTKINGSRLYSELEREIIYATINNFCSNKIENTLAVSDMSKECQIENGEIQSILDDLKEFDVETNPEDLKNFIKIYREQSFFQGAETQTIISRYNLFTSVLGITNILTLNPPSVDTFFIINQKEGPKLLEYKLISNKPLTKCGILSENTNFYCSVDGETLMVYYNISDSSFFTNTYTAKVFVISESDDELEQRTINMTYRTINLANIPIKMIITAFLVVIVSAFLIFRGKIPKKIRKAFGR